MRPASTSGAARGSLPRRRESGFTLIEMIAVALLMALVAAVTLPNLGIRSQQSVLDEAYSVASLIEFARQRAVMTGIPQRLIFDFDDQHYWLEQKREATREDDTQPARWAEERELPMFAPRSNGAEFSRSPGPGGRGYRPGNGVALHGLQTSEGLIEHGQVTLPFAWDGSTEGTVLWLIGDGGHQVRLEIAPLADAIRIEHVDS